MTLPPLPTVNTHEYDDQHQASNGSANGEANGSAKPSNGFATEAAAAENESLISLSPKSTSTTAPAPRPYDAKKEGIPLDILRGAIKGDQFDIHPTNVPAFWQWKSVASSVSHHRVTSVKPGNDISGLGSGPATSSDERMVLFFVGGGYHSGSCPEGPLSWTVCRQTSLRVLGVNFRKATTDKHAFPASLQDALAAWVYVTKRLGFKAENVILMGDSAGAGLAWTLQLYLSSLMWSDRDVGLGRARKMVLHSPWVDLTMSGKSLMRNEGVDIIVPTMCSAARDNYLRHFIEVHGRHNPHLSAKGNGAKMVEVIAGRYDINPSTLTPEMESSEHFQTELRKLANELPKPYCNWAPSTRSTPRV